MKGRFAVVLLAGALGCGHGGISEQTSQVVDSTAASLDEAYESVRSGAKTTARYGAYVIDRAQDGAVRVYRAAGGAAKGVGQDISDSTVTASVKTNLARDPMLSSGDIHVETDAGVVKLTGEVHDRHEAARAIEATMNTGGVYAVDSHLKWPASQATSPSNPPM